MCFDTDSEPPIPAISGASVSHDELVLEAADGNRFAAFAATPDETATTGVVILPDARGLYRFYEELALRFAERDCAAIAFDYFGRTAGVEKRGDDFEYMPHVQETTPEGVQADVAACVAWLREHGCTSVFTVGFCFGGRNSWLAAAWGHGLKGAVGFYGNPTAVMEHVDRIDAPILALQAGDDANITAEMNEAFDQALTVEHEVVTYAGAPHSFFDRKQEEFADASSDAWRRTLEFIAQHA
ncbi:MAG TPA: dienelactone hydrolase family protein [Candidatus Limnocylindria bacterium]|nr:dienelactone hydrolase family protein [Candidatus Limnocylindria bacterium]